MAEPAIEVDDLTVRFGGVSALDHVSLRVETGGLSAIIGPNGAGKTTLFNCLTGFYRPTTGTLRVQGHEVAGMRPSRIAALGVARTFQNLAVYQGLTVLDHILVGQYRQGRAGFVRSMVRTPAVLREEREVRRFAEEVLEMMEISRLRDSLVVELSYGMQKRVELGRAIAQRPKLLLLDEPMAGMSSSEKQELSQIVRTVCAELDLTTVLIEHDVDVVMSLAASVSVLDFGRLVTQGSPEEVRADPRVIAAYLGKPASDVATAEVVAALTAPGPAPPAGA
jgi:branched-chain amino acid transport system ATP-binding protein